jgi:hypothetical protein
MSKTQHSISINIDAVSRPLNTLFSLKLLLLLFFLYIVSVVSAYIILRMNATPPVDPQQLTFLSSLSVLFALILFAISFCLFVVGLLSYFLQKPGKQKSSAKGMIMRSIAGMIAALFIFYFALGVFGVGAVAYPLPSSVAE